MGGVLAAIPGTRDSMTASKIWLLVAIVFVIIEVLPPPTHFFCLCVALGALGASIAAFFSTSVWLPWVVFFGVTIALVPLLIPLARFLFTPRPHASNVDAVIGERALVIEPVKAHQPGQVKVRGEIWRAMTEGDSFEKDHWVLIDRVEGTHVVVKKAPPKENPS